MDEKFRTGGVCKREAANETGAQSTSGQLAPGEVQTQAMSLGGPNGPAELDESKRRVSGVCSCWHWSL